MSDHKAGKARAGLARAFGEVLAQAPLPGDPPFTPEAESEAAGFVAQTAALRAPGEPVLAIESVTGGVGARRTRIAVINDDMPFLVDSLTTAITAMGLPIDRLVHPVVLATRDAAGRLLSFAPVNGATRNAGRQEPAAGARAGQVRESVVYIEAARADARTRVRLRDALDSVLADVRAAVSDWPAMRAAIAADAERLAAGAPADKEDAFLLRWFGEGKLTQLGHVTRTRGGRNRDPLGICRSHSDGLLAPENFRRAFAWFDERPSRSLLMIKANRISRVHRRAPLDLFLVPVRKGGKVTALSVHAGLWTSAALTEVPGEVPRLRRQLAGLMDRLRFEPQGHAGKALVHALTRLPHDLLIAFEDEDLARVATSMVSLLDRPRPRVVLVQAPLRRHLFAFVWLPRDAVSTTIRLEIMAMLRRAARAEVLDWSLEVESSSLALLRFVLDIRDGGQAPDEALLDAEVSALVRGWPEAVEAALAETEDAARAAALAGRYADAFPLSYRMASSPAEAASDIRRLRRLSTDDSAVPLHRDARISCPDTNASGEWVRLKLYRRRGSLDLSDAVPMLENFGFRVAGEVPTLLRGGELGAIHDFEVRLPEGCACAALNARSEAVEHAIAAVLNGAAEDDAFNRLIVAGGLAQAEANWLRAWFRYLRQAGMTFAIQTAVDALQAAPRVTRGILDLFAARHDPAFPASRDAAEENARTAIHEGLTMVSAINDDRLLRQYAALVEAIVRTNAFVPGLAEDAGTTLAFKIDSALVPGLPRPVPWREIFVYSRRVEGIHLRAGPIARGGLRWSDRRDDFRTEVLGLMKAQRVKNAVIVPTGAKGGFYPKQLPDPAIDRDGWLAEGRAAYQVFVRSLLSLTDNIAGRKVVHPAGVVIRDQDDPYFVVAADKGTASYSDIANAIAAERDFWLDDAFASGGSKGYDHKAMGITARGAWLSVQRHFLEMGVDIQSQPIRVAGCGDMSGDVFGNGMLLSKTLRLVAAFDHRDIFLDPDPDPASSWTERKRLFDLPRSSWKDYDAGLISRGGGVFSRSQKSIPISAEAREMLGLDCENADPDTIISAILRADVDLLWFGGIGTYVKAAGEANAEVGDHANDALRVNGAQVRARVIGEGANLGCTQSGRVEFALAGSGGRGGRINTDFIDNSAGVDCSDNEVNIKIALAAARREGTLTEPARVRLLARMTDQVARIVLEDNRLQALALSIAEAGGAAAVPSYMRLVEILEHGGHLDRRTEGVADSEVLARRAADGRGLVRPELAVLLSSAKLAVQDAIEQSALPDDAGLVDDLLNSFPAAMRGKFGKEIREHRLRREIIATELANRMLNRLGLIHPFELFEEEGASLAQVAAAFVAAERLFGMDRLWQEIETAAMPESARILLFDRAAGALRPQVADLLRRGSGTLEPSVLARDLEGGVAGLDRAVGKLIGGEVRSQSAALRGELREAGAPEAIAGRIARLFELDGAVGISGLARDLKLPAPVVAAAFTDLGARLGLDWTQSHASRLAASDPWERLLVAGLARDLQQMRLEFLRRHARNGDPADAVARWTERHTEAIGHYRAAIARARAAVPVTPAMLAQLAGQARNLLLM